MLEKIWTSRIVSRYLVEFCRWFYYSFKNLGPLRIYPTNKVLEGSAEWANVTLPSSNSDFKNLSRIFVFLNRLEKHTQQICQISMTRLSPDIVPPSPSLGPLGLVG